MKKTYTEEELIELAKLAPPVKYQKSTSVDRSNAYSSVESFIDVTGIEAGRNEVDFGVLYNAYILWAKVPMTRGKFKTSFNKIFKKVEENLYKLNMKPITILEKAREIKKNEEEKEKFKEQI